MFWVFHLHVVLSKSTISLWQRSVCRFDAYSWVYRCHITGIFDIWLWTSKLKIDRGLLFFFFFLCILSFPFFFFWHEIEIFMQLLLMPFLAPLLGEMKLLSIGLLACCTHVTSFSTSFIKYYIHKDTVQLLVEVTFDLDCCRYFFMRYHGPLG